MFMDNLDRICKEHDTSASAVCAEIGKSKNSPSNWRKSGAIPNEEDLVKLAYKLDCSVGDFFVDPENPEARIATAAARDLFTFGKTAANAFEKLLNLGMHNGRIDDNVVDFTKIYSRCVSPRQRHQLMDAVYDFEDKVLSKEEETC